MGRTKHRWWGFACRMILDYPSLRDAWEEIHKQSITANMSGMPRGGGAGRTVEAIAIRQLPGDDQKVYDAVSRAIEITRQRPDGKLHLKLIECVYWRKKRVRIKYAAPTLNISVRTAERWHSDFVLLVGKCYGFEK